MERESKEMSPNMKRCMLVLNCIMLAIGIGGGPLVMRLYYLHGGKSIWLSTWLETAGWPVMIVPLLIAYFRRRAVHPKLFLIDFNSFCYASITGVIAGLGDYCYAYGVKHTEVSISSLILATQLGFTALFAFILVKLKFTPYSINAIVLLTFGAAVLALHASNDKPPGESRSQYYLGWSLTLAASALFALMLPMIELTYKKAKQSVNYTLVLEIQLVLSLSATILCTIVMLASGDYKRYAKEMEAYELGKGMYIVVLICNAIVWQFFFVGATGVVYYGSSLLSGIIITLALPVTEIGAVIFFHEQFQSEKGVSLVLSIWGFVSYFYGEFRVMKKQKKSEKKATPKLLDMDAPLP
ncbi:Purine permease 3 [Bienertia sinuspersici]